MPDFCRHGRFESTCPICSMKAKKQAAAAPTRISRTPRSSASSTRTKTRRTASGVSVRRMARAEDDGYEHELVPGLRSSLDARRLAEEIAFATARLTELSENPPGLYADVAAEQDPREAAWLAFLVAALSPLEGVDDAWAGIAAARTTFASGELPPVDEAPRGPRAAPDPATALKAFRVWLERPGVLEADSPLSADRRFDRLYERLGLPGVVRAQRYEFLVLCSRLGVGEIDPLSLRFGEPRDEATIAAKRVFAIGDTQLLSSRASELAAELGVPIAALDLGLVNWSRPPQPAGPEQEGRITAGATVDGEDLANAVAAPLGV